MTQELAKLAKDFAAAYDMGALAIQDGINVHGAVSAIVGTKEMLKQHILEEHEAEQPKSMELPLFALLQTDHCVTLINGEPVSSWDREDEVVTVYTGDMNYQGDLQMVYIPVDAIVNLPTPPGGQKIDAANGRPGIQVECNLLRPLHPRDFKDGKVRIYD